jgi:hypothetical protein
VILTVSLLVMGCAGDGGVGGEAGESAPIEERVDVSSEQTVAEPESGTPSAPVSPDDLAGLPAPILPINLGRISYPLDITSDISLARQALLEVVQSETSDPTNPWAIAHGLVALGSEMRLSNGELAIDYLFSEYAEEVSHGDNILVTFPASGETEEGGLVRIEPHTDLIVKALIETDVRLDRQVVVAGNPHQVGELWLDTVLTSHLNMADGSSSWEGTDDMAWGLQAIAAFAPEGMTWSSGGVQMSLDEMSELTAHVLTSESMFLLEAMQSNGGFTKEGQGIFAYTCGGAHLLQTASYLTARGFGGAAAQQKLQAQVDLLFYRFPRELAIYDTAVAAAPTQELIITVQRLKFIGHWIESAYKMAATGLFEPSVAQQSAMAEAVGLLVETVAKLKSLGALDNLADIRSENEQLYLDIVGDSAHAVRGLDLALGLGEVRY